MSAASGISASEDLLREFSNAVTDQSIRFLKIAIQREALVPEGAWPSSASTLSQDLSQLDSILLPDVPAYILARLDNGTEWLFISYVPDTAKVRDKMLYASSRSALTKALGGQAVKDTLFATSKKDLTPEAYAAHLRHVSAPQPMSAREAELAEIQAAERQVFEGSRGRKNHVGTGVGVVWTAEVEDAVKALVGGQGGNLLILGIASEAEGVQVVDTKDVGVNGLATALPKSEPSYAFYRYDPTKIIFIYTCPPTSSVKLRMVYSMGVSSVTQAAQESAGFQIHKKLEASDPADLDLSSFATAQEQAPVAAKPTGPPSFARPRGPPRKR